MDNFGAFTINQNSLIREVFKNTCFNDEKFIIVVDDDNKVTGVLTDGDFRRAVWNSVSLDDVVKKIVNKDFVYIDKEEDLNKAGDFFATTEIKHIPVLANGELINVIFKNSYLAQGIKPLSSKLDIPVVIMAGGTGTRLDPFTRILPKPLIPIGEKPIIEIIIDKFREFGINHFYLSINYKANMIKAFFEEVDREYKISYLEEKKPLGTAGALKLLNDRISSSFIVTNCDTVIEEDYRKIVDFHKKGEYLLTLIGAMQHHVVPYGVCEVDKGGELGEFKERPEYDVLVNTGMYILSLEVLNYIPEDKRFDMTMLIQLLKQKGEKVGVYPVQGKSWLDIGQWEEYKKAVNKLQ
ncbi:MAG: nucleotidyltransferase family protein [bacterium]